uniref:EGF-like domain-containing protein n=1 Tax=Magallana gigas TaxID=29159 RepID=A0A8W8L437_MAGGI
MADSYILVYLNNKPTRIELSSFETNSLYFAGGIWIGALASRESVVVYVCQRRIPTCDSKSFISGSDISNQCSALTRHCDNANICGTGTCAYSDQSNYICHCEGTGFGGDRCDRCKLPISNISGPI